MNRFDYDDRFSASVITLAKQLTILAHDTLPIFLTWRLERRHLFVNDGGGIRFLTTLLDATYHTSSSKCAINHYRQLWQNGLPKGMPSYERFLFFLAVHCGRVFPKFVCFLVLFYTRFYVRDLLFCYGSKSFDALIRQRESEGVWLNFNKLGEAVLSHEEADASFQEYIALLQLESVQFLSVKLSALSCQIDPLNWQETRDDLVLKFSKLLRLATQRARPVFITLDMESYVELPLTVSVFQSVLSQDEFLNVSAGIALQAYLFDSFFYQELLTKWAIERVSKGGAPIKIRLVKGANLAMERWQSVSKGWPLPVFSSKLQTDISYKKMIVYAMSSEHLSAVHIGIGSHNVFDIAFVMELKKRLGLGVDSPIVLFEMLEGMAPGLMSILRKMNCPVLSYCPVTTQAHFRAGLSYLVRRLDEQSAKHHIIKDFIHLYPETPLWESYQEQFLASLNDFADPVSSETVPEFENYPDTQWHNYHPFNLSKLPVLSSDVLNFPLLYSKSSPSTYVDTAEIGLQRWAFCSIEERLKCCEQLRVLLVTHKDTLLSLLMFEGKKVLKEADSEFSEAMDFIQYYSQQLCHFINENPEVLFDPKGIVVVTPPWNFPLAIPLGGVLAALLTGNAVIFKPAPEVKHIGCFLAKLFWDSGFPQDVLQCAIFDREDEASLLIKDPRVSTIVLTGSSETASLFLSWRPDVHLLAETGGKNTMIVSSFSDKDLVIQDVLQSAFGHAGQKCSALSLLILHKDVYDDATFLTRLKHAAHCLKVGPSDVLSTQVSALIRQPSSSLYRALTQLEPGESWLLQPFCASDDPCLWSPGIKLGVSKTSFFYNTECFGPVLGVMRADSMEHAISLANGTSYGLTAGLYSLDPDEQTLWMSKVQSGNLYINRSITGALVHRQPFGGWKASRFGYGFKAGGPFYLLGFVNLKALKSDVFSEEVLLQDVQKWSDYYLSTFQHSRFYGQNNTYRFVGYSSVTIRVYSELKFEELLMMLYCAYFTTKHVYLSVSHPISLQSLPRIFRRKNIQVVVETLDACVGRLAKQDDALLRVSSPQFQSVVGRGKFVVSKDPVLLNVKFEILKYLKEQSISHTTHRYGL